MNAEKLFEAIGIINEKYLIECEEVSAQRKRFRVPVFAGIAGIVAACLCVFAAGALLIPKVPPIIGGNTAGGGHNDGSSVFMHYEGPVFPLSVLQKDGDISAARSITFDFDPSEKPQDLLRNDIIVRDKYTLTNSAQTDKNITVLYPFAGSIDDIAANTPRITAGGEDIEAELHVGGYTGGYTSAIGDDSDGPQLNIMELDSWEQYDRLLSDGAYLDRALNYSADFSDIPVTVYKFSDSYFDGSTDAVNPTVRATFYMDYDKTRVLTYGFNGGSYIFGKGTAIREYSMSEYTPQYMLVLGDDISPLEIGYYATGGVDTTEKLTEGSAGVTLERYETNLDEILRVLVNIRFSARGEQLPFGFEKYYSLYCKYFEECGIMSGHSRYSDGAIDGLDFEVCGRVMYLSAEITVPAGKSVELEVAQVKGASYDYYGTSSANSGINGYDAVTKTGTLLQITNLSAEIVNYDNIEIARQNFGFDPDSGVTRVALDTENAHYYIEVKEKIRQ